MKQVLLVGLGGGIGSMARYLCQRWFSIQYLHNFPWGTFAVNMSGCLLIGIFWGLSFKTFDSNESWKLFLMTGICGGFTTFSAFSLEGIGLLGEQKGPLFFLYAAGSVIGGLFLTWIGMKLVRG